MKLLSVEEAGLRLGVSPRSLIDKRYRLRLGLSAVKIGRKVGFAESDIDKLIECSREHLPRARRRWTNFLLALLRFCLRQLARRIDARSFDAALSIEIDRICAVLELLH